MNNVHAEVVGSLLRPPYLLDARERYERGDLPAPAFKKIEDRAVDEAIRIQEECGIDVITDGELRRYAFFGHFVDAHDGFDKSGGSAITFHDERGEELIHRRAVVVDKLRPSRNMCAEEFTYLRARTQTPSKVTMLSPHQVAAYYDPERSKGAYPTREAFLADIVDLSRREIEELVRLGCGYVQVDAPLYATLLDPRLRDGHRQRGADPEKLLDAGIEMDNAIIADHPGLTFGLHICRGNNQSKFYAAGDYGPISCIFQRTRFDRFLLEYDDERSGGFEPLRNVPEDRVVVLGLITTKKQRLEAEDEIKRRIDEASRYVPLERLGLSPQCGFASTIEGNRVSMEDQHRKLRLVGKLAREVWGGMPFNT